MKNILISIRDWLYRACEALTYRVEVDPKCMVENKYDTELLSTLKSIDNHLEQLSKCVKSNHHSHGDKHSISTKHWNG